MTLNLSESTILVTGSAGFIGSHLTERLLKEGAHVRAFVRYNSEGNIGNLRHLVPLPDNLEIHFGDLRNPDATRKAMQNIDIVFNLASIVSIPYSYRSPREFFDNNIYFILNILESARTLNTEAVVHVSTSEVYGTAESVPISENHPLKGQSPYSASKIGADMAAISYYRSFDSPVVITRPFNTYGPRQSERAVIPTMITQALSGNAVFLGDVRPTRDFNYVDDIVDGIRAAAVNAPKVFGQVINLGTGVESRIEEVARKIIDLTNAKVKIVFDASKVRPPSSEVQRLCADASRAMKLLGWKSKVILEEGLLRTIKWYKKYHPTHRDVPGHV